MMLQNYYLKADDAELLFKSLSLEMEIGIYLWNRALSRSTKLRGPVIHVAVEKTSHFS